MSTIESLPPISCMILALVVVVATGCQRSGADVAEQATSSSPSTETAERATDDDRYRARIQPEAVAPSENTTLQLEIVPGSGLKVNKEYPQWELTLQPPEELAFEQTTFGPDDFDLQDGRASVTASVKATAPGTHSVPAEAGFSVCNDQTCHIMRDEQLTFRLRVSSRDDQSADNAPSTP